MTMKPFILTGAAGGIGVETARAIARPDRRLVCVDVDQDRLDEAIPAGLPGEVVRVVSRLESPKACAAVVEAAGGEISGLIHLAGILDRDDDINADDTHWDRVIDANLRNAYELSGEVVRRLTSDGPAKFVFASSLAFRRGAPENVAYAISKGGIVGLVRSLARRLGPRATVNAVAPGIITTAMPRDLIARHGQRLLNDIPLKRFAGPEEVASVIDFLASSASDYVTGQVLNVDGGMVTS